MDPVPETASAAASAARAASRDERPEATQTIEGIAEEFRRHGYIAERSLATTVFLALELGRPLLLEGEAGVGKTELAKVLAKSLGTRLIRLQCYEGLDVNTAVYEWNYPRQMLEIRLLEARGEIDRASAHDIFGPEFLLKRPLLQALEADGDAAPVLLIDEIDRADEEFEAYLLEILSDFQVTVPEIGTIRANRPPRVVLTSNRTREVHDALKRRCLYHWIDYPTASKEFEIVSTRVPDAPARLAREVVAFVHRLRTADLTKVPGVAETLDWASALLSLGAAELSPDVVDETLGVVLKYEEDIRQVRGADRRDVPRRGDGPGVAPGHGRSRDRRRPVADPPSRRPGSRSTAAGCSPSPWASGGRSGRRASRSTSRRRSTSPGRWSSTGSTSAARPSCATPAPRCSSAAATTARSTSACSSSSGAAAAGSCRRPGSRARRPTSSASRGRRARRATRPTARAASRR